MKTLPFGSTGLMVSELCLGTSTFARFASQEETFAMLDAFRAGGGNFVQTSGICPGAHLGDGFLGLPEEFFGRWLDSRGVRRRDMVIATRMGFARPLLGGDAYGDLVRACVRDSLRRIGTEHIDFLVVEWSDALLPTSESLASIEAIVREGSARHVMLAHCPNEQLDAIAAGTAGGLAGLQLDYSLIYRARFERGPAAFCAAHGVGFVARSPLAGGHLVCWPPPEIGSFGWRSAGDPFTATCAHAVWPTLRRVAARHAVIPAQVSLAWVLAQPGVTSTLISARSLTQLQELIAATDLHLSRDEGEQLRADASPNVGIPLEPGPSNIAPVE